MLLDLMQRASGEPPVLWGSMIGFGHYSYRTDSGHKGEMFLTGFAPRKANMVIYVMPGFEGLAGDLNDCSFMIPHDAPVADASLAVLNPVWPESLGQLLTIMNEGPARLIIAYTGSGEHPPALLNSRIRQAETAIRAA